MVPLAPGYAGLSALEWLETNGLGGYASGTVSGASTRGYHGWLVAAITPPAERMMIVTGCDESLMLEPPVSLSTHQYPGVVSPAGYELLESFEATPFPTWTYRTSQHRVERRLFMVQGQNTTVARYRLLAGPPVTLGVRPFLVFRGHHERRYASDDWRPRITARAGAYAVRRQTGQCPLSLTYPTDAIETIRTGICTSSISGSSSGESRSRRMRSRLASLSSSSTVGCQRI